MSPGPPHPITRGTPVLESTIVQLPSAGLKKARSSRPSPSKSPRTGIAPAVAWASNVAVTVVDAPSATVQPPVPLQPPPLQPVKVDPASAAPVSDTDVTML